MTKLRTLLVDFKSYYPSPPYQLGLLVAYAKTDEDVARAMDFEFLECPRTMAVDAIVEGILAFDADLICASCYAWNYKKVGAALDILARSGRRLPPIVLGGPNSAGTFGEMILERYPSVTALVDGEGEPAFLDICRSMVAGGDPFANARNTVVRANGGVVRRDPGHRIQSLDEIPSPYLEGILPPAPSPVFYETNRGCPYRCSFCYWGNGNAKIYRMSHERIREEMEFFAKNRVSFFWIADANFGIFRDDAEIAELMAEINTRHGRPFQHVGVNWAKNSSDEVLRIAEIFRRGGMGCTTTLALQSVTEEAGAKSQRYSMPASRFTGLVRHAEEKGLDTYTDIIWGLPGESYEEFMTGLDAVVCTAVPAMYIHQLYLLPGTEFWDDRESFGLEMLSTEDLAAIDEEERSAYAEYIVVSHPDMPPEDQVRGSRIMGINHVLHNHFVGTVPGFFLARYGLSHRDVYEHFDDVLRGSAPAPERGRALLERFREHIVRFAENIGLDEFLYYRRLSDLVWFAPTEGRQLHHNLEELEELLVGLFDDVLARHDVSLPAEERTLLHELIRYGVLVSPRPAWRPAASDEFGYDVHALWQDMHGVILATGEAAEVTRNETGRKSKDGGWPGYGERVRAALRELLTDEYLASRRGPTSYSLRNPWALPPGKDNSDWLMSSRTRRAVVSYADGAPAHGVR